MLLVVRRRSDVSAASRASGACRQAQCDAAAGDCENGSSRAVVTGREVTGSSAFLIVSG